MNVAIDKSYVLPCENKPGEVLRILGCSQRYHHYFRKPSYRFAGWLLCEPDPDLPRSGKAGDSGHKRGAAAQRGVGMPVHDQAEHWRTGGSCMGALPGNPSRKSQRTRERCIRQHCQSAHIIAACGTKPNLGKQTAIPLAD